MPRKLYSLDQEGKQMLAVSWKGNFKNLELKLNNKPLGKAQGKQELVRGKEFEISHDKILSVKLVKEMYLFTRLELLVNGFPVESSMTHPVRKLNDVFLLIMFIAAINLIFGLLGLMVDNDLFRILGAGFWNIIYAGIFTILGIIMKENKSMFAMISIVGLMMLDIMFSFFYIMEIPGHVNPAGNILVKVFLMLYLLRGVTAIKDFRKLEKKREIQRIAEEEKMQKIPPSQQVTEDHSKFMPGDHSAYMPGERG